MRMFPSRLPTGGPLRTAQQKYPEEFARRDQEKYNYRYPHGEVRRWCGAVAVATAGRTGLISCGARSPIAISSCAWSR